MFDQLEVRVPRIMHMKAHLLHNMRYVRPCGGEVLKNTRVGNRGAGLEGQFGVGINGCGTWFAKKVIPTRWTILVAYCH